MYECCFCTQLKAMNNVNTVVYLFFLIFNISFLLTYFYFNPLALVHSEIRSIVESNLDKNFWVGLSDEMTEGKWLFSSNGQEANIDEMIFKWREGQPDNAGDSENCAHTWDKSEMNDVPCSLVSAWGKYYYGLCEIKADHC